LPRQQKRERDVFNTSSRSFDSGPVVETPDHRKSKAITCPQCKTNSYAAMSTSDSGVLNVYCTYCTFEYYGDPKKVMSAVYIPPIPAEEAA
jgi:hypothetical protein